MIIFAFYTRSKSMHFPRRGGCMRNPNVDNCIQCSWLSLILQLMPFLLIILRENIQSTPIISHNIKNTPTFFKISEIPLEIKIKRKKYMKKYGIRKLLLNYKITRVFMILHKIMRVFYKDIFILSFQNT